MIEWNKTSNGAYEYTNNGYTIELYEIKLFNPNEHLYCVRVRKGNRRTKLRNYETYIRSKNNIEDVKDYAIKEIQKLLKNEIKLAKDVLKAIKA